MKNIKVLLADPRHSTVGSHSGYVPINIGYIGAFLKKDIKELHIDVKLAVDTEEIFTLLNTWKPDVIGMSNYVWNASLSNTFCKHAKNIKKNTLCILGGPEFPAGTGARKIENTSTEPTYDKCLKYLIERPSVDYFAYCDGEVVFSQIIKNFIKNKFSVKLMKDSNVPIKGCASLSKNNDKLLVGEYLPRIGMDGSVKAEGRDIIPSPYLTGTLDKFLDGSLMPAFETARGCPFLCTFCDQGIDETKITTFSSKRLAEEMMYVGKKIYNIKNGTKTIGIFDSNWGLFEKDIKLADEIAKVMDKYDWPKYIYCSTPKDKKENLLKIDAKLKNRVSVGLAMQSMNSDVLTKIKRNNIGYLQQIKTIKEIQKRGKQANTELIIPMPGETEETYFEGLKFLMDNNVMTGTYTLMMLCGAELGRDEAIKKYGMISKFRILPKQFGNYYGNKVFEIEQVCVATNTMSYESYLKCRNMSFTVRLVAQQIFSPIHKLTEKLEISWFSLTKEIATTLQNKNFKGELKDLYDGFSAESHEELFDSREEAIAFYSREKNYKSLVQGDIGENLSEKYTAKAILAFDDILTTVFNIIKNKLIKNLNKDSELILNSAEKWLKNLYLIDEIFDDNKEFEKPKHYKLKIDFDFPNWVRKNHLPFDQFKNKCTYMVDYDIKKMNYFRNEKNSIFSNYKGGRGLARFIRAQMQKGPAIFEKQFQKIN